MRIRVAALAVPAVSAAAAALLLTAPQSQAAPGRAASVPAASVPAASVPAASGHAARTAVCPARALALRAKASAAHPSVVRIRVTNRSGRACTVDRVPTVTFGNLDGAALPVPAGGGGTYRLGAGRAAYAAVRTIADPADPEARRVPGIAVSPVAARAGRSFTAAELGAGRAVRVWEPVTTWWQPSAAAADRALGLS
ncbi:DUF4232 domain-containing protein [Streptomyces sp. NPDC006739]|uniref:DUF4232 domain-containing protein n=1 Tax=Streptomyces sp. NPDC006739 TaxID=3364763 RepID=UPI0036AA6C86